MTRSSRSRSGDPEAVGSSRGIGAEFALPSSAVARRRAERRGRRFRSRSAALLLLAGGIAHAAPASAAPPIAVSGASPFAACSADDVAGQAPSVLFPDSEVEPHLAVNPTNPRNVVASWQQDRWSDGGARGLVTAASFDGGRTWQRSAVPGLTSCSGGPYLRSTDPWLAFAPNGDLHHAAFSFNGTDAIQASRSSDGGLTWSEPILVDASALPACNDKEAITADPHDARFVYLVWSRFPDCTRPQTRVLFSRSTDGGASWEPARVLHDPGSRRALVGAQIVVLPDGRLVALLSENQRIVLRYSLDRGETWLPNGDPVLVSQQFYWFASDPESGASIRSSDWLIDVDVDPVSGALYATWQDLRFTSWPQVVFIQSLDGGATWSAPIVIAQTELAGGTGGVQSFLPSIAVAANGVVGVSYFDFRFDVPDGAASTDHWIVRCDPLIADCSTPEGWGHEQRITPDSFDFLAAPLTDRGFFLGDYVGLASAGDDFLALFAQSSALDPATVYFARIAPVPACSNGRDDDGDGWADYPNDPGCPIAEATTESPPCDDGIDNDGDGLVDADDPVCETQWPYWEKVPACGLGAELALILPALLALGAGRRGSGSGAGA